MLIPLLLACQRPAPLVVLVSFDTTRADRLGAYGLENAGTPNLDRLAEEGVLFEWALSQSPTTLASHTSVFSGLDAHKHSVVRNGYPLADGLDLIGERFQAAGWDTLGVIGASPLQDSMNIHQGFRVWEDHELKPYLGQVEVGADEVNAKVFEILEQAGRPKPTLLFVHYYDPHSPWTSAPVPMVQARTDSAYSGELGQDERAVRLLSDPHYIAQMTESDKAQAWDLYQAEIEWTDQQFGELLAGLERRGRLEDSLVVVFSDHGESMNDNPWSTLPYGHGPDVDLDVLRVPLLFRGEGSLALPAKVRVERQVRLQDIGTTVLGHAGLGGPLGDGEDLAPLWSGAPGGRIPLAFAEATKPIPLESKKRWNNLPFERSVANGERLLVVSPLTRTLSLHGLDAAQTSIDEADTRAALLKELEAWDRAAPPYRDPEMTGEMEEALKRLGYLE